jgi:hypothetical protein
MILFLQTKQKNTVEMGLAPSRSVLRGSKPPLYGVLQTKQKKLSVFKHIRHKNTFSD